MKNLFKTIALLSLLALAGCGTITYIQGDAPIIVKSVQKNSATTYLVEAYAKDNKGGEKWVYFETSTKYSAGDTLPGLGER